MQNQSEEEREKKYNLLQKEIIDKQLDPLEFQVFCETIKKDGGDNIDAWDYSELVNTIIQFQQKQLRKSQIMQSRTSIMQKQQEEIKNESQEEISKNREPSVSQSLRQTSKAMDDSNYYIEVECKTPMQSELTKFIKENQFKQVEITIDEYNVNYALFRVDTFALSWSVWRRFSDFLWLSKQLKTAFPLQLIPPISKKKIKVNATDPSYLQKRQRILELFLQNILYNPVLRSHPVFSDFLSISDEAQFKLRLSYYDKIQGPNRPSGYMTINGVCTLEISEKTKKYAQSLNDYLRQSTDVYKRLGENFKKLFLDLDELSNTLNSIQENFSSLNKVTETFANSNQDECSTEIKSVNFIYQELSNFILGWQQGTLFQMKNVKENFYEFFRYHKKMQEQAQEYLQQRNQMCQKYQENNQKLQERREKLFTIGDTSKWELSPDCPIKAQDLRENKQEAFKYMLSADQKLLDLQKDNFAFINKNINEEVNSMICFRSLVYCKRFQRVAQMRALETAKLHHVLADFLQNLLQIQGQVSGQFFQRSASIYTDNRYDSFFGIKPQATQQQQPQ